MESERMLPVRISLSNKEAEILLSLLLTELRKSKTTFNYDFIREMANRFIDIHVSQTKE